MKKRKFNFDEQYTPNKKIITKLVKANSSFYNLNTIKEELKEELKEEIKKELKEEIMKEIEQQNHTKQYSYYS